MAGGAEVGRCLIESRQMDKWIKGVNPAHRLAQHQAEQVLDAQKNGMAASENVGLHLHLCLAFAAASGKSRHDLIEPGGQSPVF